MATITNLLKNEIAQTDLKWQEFFDSVQATKWWQNLLDFLEYEYQSKTIYPQISDLFNAFKLCQFSQLKVLILGQDPYHTPNLANGLAFAVDLPNQLPGSLRNIIKKVENEYGLNGTLSYLNLRNWAKQGVLLLNTKLTVVKNYANSHDKMGWEPFIDHLLSFLKLHCPDLVYVVWGKNAANLIKNHAIHAQYCIITSHPSPLSANISFFKLPVFKKVDQLLIRHKKPPIKWYPSHSNE